MIDPRTGLRSWVHHDSTALSGRGRRGNRDGEDEQAPEMGDAVIVLGAVVAEMSWARKDAAFAQYMQIGQEINLLLTRYRAEFERTDLDRLLAFYADDYRAPQSGRWDLASPATKDEIQSAKFIEVDTKDRTKADLKEQLAAYLGTSRST